MPARIDLRKTKGSSSGTIAKEFQLNFRDPFGLQEEPRTVADVGEISLTVIGKGSQNARIIGIDNRRVTLEYTWKRTKKTATLEIKAFSDEDRAFIAQLQLVLPNIIIDPFGLKGDAAKEWVKTVVADFAKLNELATGKRILDSIENVLYPPRGRDRIPIGIAYDTPIRIRPSTSTVGT